uniref:Ribokinase n=1 Tax=Ascaris suum TaxID=6253 RepID=F1LA31_ASCSU
MSDIVVFGSIVQDLISYATRFPRPGESIRGVSFEVGCGGRGANQAAQIARLGGKVIMIGMVGNDIFGPLNIENLRKSGVNTDYIEKSNEAGTATATVTVTEEGENSVVVILGANLEIKPSRAEQLEHVIANSKMLLCQYEIPYDTLKCAFEIARKNNVTVFFNFSPSTPEFDISILKLVDVLCTNRSETENLSGRNVRCVEEAVMAVKTIIKLGPKAVITTLGAKGAVVATEDGLVVHVPVPPVKAVDTTGAGDSFCGSLAYLMVSKPNLPLEEQVHRAQLVASISVQRKGAQASYPWAHDLPDDILG